MPPPAEPGDEQTQPALPRRVWDSLPLPEGRFIAEALRQETVGGILLLVSAILAVGWANSPWSDSYEQLRSHHLGPLSVEHWAADFGLAVFFFLAGIELKRELVVGSLSRVADAMVPVVAALAGMVMPALIYLAVNSRGGDLSGWAVPMATDIAFALAVLAVVGRSLPAALRAFLLTLAVVDDLGAIAVIATVFTASIRLEMLAGAVVLLALFAYLQRRRVTSRLVYLPLALATWWFVYESGVHATVAGVALGLLTRVRQDEHEESSPAERLEHRIRPLSAAVAVPFFAFVSAGVSVDAGAELLRNPIVLGIALGLIVGKTIGISGGAWLVTRLTRAELAPEVTWTDIIAVSVLSGVGFTVSLLIAELAFSGTDMDAAKTAVLAASVLAAFVASVLLRGRNRDHARQTTT